MLDWLAALLRIRDSTARIGFRVVFPYLLLSAAWILLSGRLVSAIASTPEQIEKWELVKGWIFAAVTAALLYIAVRDCVRRIKAAHADVAFGEERFRTLVTQTAAVVWRGNAAGDTIGTEPSYSAITGLPGDALNQGADWFDAVHPDDREAARRTWQKAFAAEAEYHNEYRLRSAGGSWRDMVVRGVPLRNRDGAVHEWFGICVDVTERRAADRAYHGAAQLHTAVLDALPASVALLDEHGVIVSVNESWRRFGSANGFDDADCGVGTNYLEICERADGQNAAAAQEVAVGLRALLNGTRGGLDLEYPCHSPEEKRWFRLIAAPIVLADRRGVTVMHVDITRRRAVTDAAQMQAHILNNTGDAVIATDPDGKLLYMNRAAEELYGWSFAEIAGRDINELNVPAASMNDAIAIMDQVLRGEAWSGEFTVQSRSGRSFPIAATMTSLRNEAGEITTLIAVSRDISGRKKVEEQLRLRQAQLQQAQELAQLGSWEWDIARDELTWSVEMRQIVGACLQETTRIDCFREAVHPDDRPRVETAIASAIAGSEPYDCTFRVRRPDGEERTVHSRGRVVRGGNGEPLRLIGMSQDVTRQEKAAELLRESERRFRQLAENIDEVFWVVDVDREESLYVSPAYERVWGRSRETLRQNMWAFMDAVIEEDRPLLREFNQAERARATEVTYRIRRPDGTIRWIYDRAFPVQDEAGRVYRVAGIAHDITEQKQAEATLAQQQDELRALAERANEVREQEAVRISRELHDELGQALTALTFDVANVQRQVTSVPTNGEGSDLATPLQRIQQRLHDTIETTHRICTELRPAMLDQLGLAAAIEWQAKEFEGRTGILCDLILPTEEPALSNSAATATFRILQEVLTNVARHSKATEVRIELAYDKNELRLDVTDNGKGAADAEISRAGRLGILGIRERALAVGGGVEIGALPGRGTLVSLRLPLSTNGHERA